MLTSHVQYDRNTATVAHEFVSSSGNRYSITFFAPISGVSTILDDTSLLSGSGFSLVAGMAPITLRLDVHGSCVQRAWYCVNDAGLNPVGYIEALM